jgi:hypothetical protein
MSRPALRARYLWLIPGLAIALYASGQAGIHGLGLVPLLVFSIVPHLPVLVGYVQPHAQGQLPSQAVPFFNAMHHPVPPLAVLGLAAAGVLSPVWLVCALAWLSHIAIDWAMGDGLRAADGYLDDRSVWSARPLGPVTRGPERATSWGRS